MNHLTRLRNWLASHLVESFGMGLAVLSIIVVFGGYFSTRSWSNSVASIPDFVQEMFSNFGTELLSIAITILVVDYLNRRRQKVELDKQREEIERQQEKQMKDQLIRDMGGQSNDFALRAVRDLRSYGWLKDGSLGQYLRHFEGICLSCSLQYLQRGKFK